MNLVVNHPNIAIFDLQEIESSEGEDRKKIIDSLSISLKTYGFIGIKVSPELNDLVDRAYKIAKQYFDLSPNQKNLDLLIPERGGYQGLGVESLSNLGAEANDSLPEVKESYLYLGNSPRIPENKTVEFSPISDLHNKMHELGNRILNIIQEYFNIDGSEQGEFDSQYGCTRLTGYQPIDKNTRDKVTWCGGHFDTSPFALLPKATAPGLQMKIGQDWIEVEVPDNVVILNTGRLFEAITAGVIKPTYHRVIPNEKTALTGRISIIHFPAWGPDYFIKPWRNCLNTATDGMENDEEKNKFEKSLLKGTTKDLFRMFSAMANNYQISDDEIREIANQFPDNETLKARWPWAFEKIE